MEFERPARAARVTTMAAGCLGLAFAITLSACGDGAQGTYGSPTVPSNLPAVNASMNVTATPQDLAFWGSSCVGNPRVAATFDVVIAASRPVDILDMTTTLIGGESPGPAVTFPQPDLVRQFGTTRVLAGVPRTFSLRPAFPCNVGVVRSAVAKVTYVNPDGSATVLTISRPLP